MPDRDSESESDSEHCRTEMYLLILIQVASRLRVRLGVRVRVDCGNSPVEGKSTASLSAASGNLKLFTGNNSLPPVLCSKHQLVQLTRQYEVAVQKWARTT